MLGDKLREAREKQNLTYKDIEKGTSIRALYIEYIENGNYDELPGDVYTKGFIRSYANFLKLNPNEFVQEFTAERQGGASKSAAPAPQNPAPARPVRQENQEPAAKPNAPAAPKAAAPKATTEPVKPSDQLAPKAEAKPAVKMEQPKAAPAPEKKATPAPQTPARSVCQERPEQPAVKPAPKPQAQSPARLAKSAAPKERPACREKPTAKYDLDEPKRSNTKFIAIVAVILVVLAGAAYALSGSDDSASKAPQQTQQEQAPAPKTYDDVEVTAAFTADCWLEVKADDKTIYEGTLKKGDTQTWKGQDKVTIRVGDAGAVSFSVNGKDLGKAGKDGQVANKTFTKENN